ncbi:MAG: amino acid permease [Candidatus Rehaiarchaeum fermentans]|nr:amino acid permease [Candidatus Rehaiarchaeum fermentans]
MKGQKKTKSNVKKSVLPKETKNKGPASHTLLELYWHDLSAVIGIGVIVVPIIVSYLVGVFSIFLVLFVGILALVIGTILYEVEAVEGLDPYKYLGTKVSKEYSFIFGFLLVIAYILIVILAGEVGVLELSQFFGSYGVYVGLILVELFLIATWAVLSMKREKFTLNFMGIIKLLFVIALIIAGFVAVKMIGVKPFLNAINGNSNYINLPQAAFMSLGIILLFFSFVGFETGSFAFKGPSEKRYIVAEAIMYSILTGIVVYTLIQIFAIGLGNYNSSNPFLGFSLFPNFIGQIISYPAEVFFSIFSIVVVLGSVVALSNASSKVLHMFALDGIVPASLADSENLKLSLSLGIPIVLLPVVSLIAGPLSSTTSSFISDVGAILPIISVASMSVLLAFAFLSAGMAYANRNKSWGKLLSGIFITLVILGIIGFAQIQYLVGLLVIVALGAIGYVIVARNK